MDAHGFVVCVDLDGERPGERHDETTTEEGLAWGPWFAAYSRPRSTTPDACREHQPWVKPGSETNVVLVYEGRLDNREELAARLLPAGTGPPGDAELLAASYEAWGADLVQHAWGEFCFALIDLGVGRLVAGHDPLGLRKLYTYLDGGCLWIASNLALLMSATRMPFALSSDAIAAFLSSAGILGPTGRTLLEGVDKLRAGRVLICDRGAAGPRTVPGWEPSLEAPRRNRTKAQLDRELRQRLDECIAPALRSSGPVCIELSGGLDSSTVFAVTHELLRAGRVDGVDSFALSYTASESTESDETRFQRAALAKYPSEHYAFDIDELPGVLQVEAYREPAMVDTQGWLAEARSRVRAVRPASVCLTGQGGDAVFSMAMPPMELAWLWRTLHWGEWARTLRAWASSGTYSVRELLWTFTRGDVLRAWGENLMQTPPWLTSDWASRAAAARVDLLTGAGGRYQGDFQAFHWKIIKDCGESMPDPATFSWELRCPLMARPMVEFALGLPLEERRTPSRNRIAQRRALTGVLPEEIRTRPTKGAFSVVFLNTLRKNAPQWESLFRGSHLAEMGIVEPALFRQACLRLKVGVVEELDYLTAALLLEAWLALDRPGPPRVATFRGELGDLFAAWRKAAASFTIGPYSSGRTG